MSWIMKDIKQTWYAGAEAAHLLRAFHGNRSASYHFIILYFFIFSFFTLSSCSTDFTEEDWRKAGITIEAVASASEFEEAEVHQEAGESKSTRAWIPPTNYYLYESLYASGTHIYHSLSNATIDVFFTQPSSDDLHGRLSYSPSTNKWKFTPPRTIDPKDIGSGDYYAYGFIPREAADEATISMLDGSSTYYDGAKLTIQGLETVAYDACVIIGAKHGDPTFSAGYSGSYDDLNDDNTYNDGDIKTHLVQAGDFTFHLNTGESATNYLYFLFDHLCSALSISMRVDGLYNTLRTIKLKELRLQTSDGVNLTKKKMDVTITLEQNSSGSNPIKNITFTPRGTESCNGIVYQNTDGLTLTTDYNMFMGHFIPEGVTHLILTSTYDVYDKNVTLEHPEGNLIRQNCTATNTFKFTELFTTMDHARRGWKYNLNLTIQPTYLYMMSEPDLDNPTLVGN